MTETRLLDYSDARPSPAAVKKAGAVGVMRYLSHTPSKNLTRAEAATLHKAGLVIGLVWETTADRATEGAAAGRQDRAEAEKQAAALGYPAECPIWYAVDFDAAPSAVSRYFAGAVKAPGTHPVGVYGGVRVMALPVAAYWQTAAWSKGELSPRADIYQRGNRQGPYVRDTDENVVCRPVHLWGPGGAVLVEPGGAAPAPKPRGFSPLMRGAVRIVIARGERRHSSLSPHARHLTERLVAAGQRMLGLK